MSEEASKQDKLAAEEQELLNKIATCETMLTAVSIR